MDTKALRQKILDLAIRGKLVPQDPNDEPASVLLERIRAEKQQMVKEGKLKAKDIKNDTVIFKGDDNLHYEKYGESLPNGWVVTNFGTLLSYEQPTKYIVNDTNYKPTYKTPVLTAGKSFILGYTNETDNIFDDLPVIIFDDFTTESKFVDFPFKVKSSAMKILHINQDLVLPKYAFYLMQATEIDHDNHQRYWISTYSQEIISLPPLSEQIKIIETVENLFDLTQSVETNSQNLKNSIKTTKSKILDLAIRGKLVPQDPNDEPASVLLERIRAEKEELIKQGKIKRDKKESVIFKGDDNSYYRLTSDNKRYDVSAPFDLPDCWEWTTFPTVAHVELGKTLDKVKNTGTYYPYLRSVNVQWGYVDLSDVKEMKFEPEEIERYTIKKNDLLICEGGDVGRCCVWNKNESILYQNAIHRVRFYNSINCNFYMYFMMYLEAKGTLKRISNGVTIKHLTNTVLTNITIPLPPLAEQERIVNAVETLFAQIDKIAEQIS